MAAITPKIYKLKSVKDNIVFFDVEGFPKSIHLADLMDYRSVSRTANSAHMMEPDGNIFRSVNPLTHPTPLTSAHICPVHHEPPGCKFSSGAPFTEGFKNRNPECRCYGKFATQYEFDRWNWMEYKNKTLKLNDNARVFMRLGLGKSYEEEV